MQKTAKATENTACDGHAALPASRARAPADRRQYEAGKHGLETGILWRAELVAPLRGKELLAKGNYAGLTEAERKAVEVLPDNGTVIRPGVNVQAVEISAKPGITERELRVVPFGIAAASAAVVWATTGNANAPRPEIPK